MKEVTKGIIFLFCLLPLVSLSQSVYDMKPVVRKKPVIIIDYSSDHIANTQVPFRGDLNNLPSARLSGNLATFDVTYINFNQEQEEAFQKAVDIWSSLLQSDVVIHLRAEMRTFSSGNTLGSTSIPEQVVNFDNAQKVNTFYNVALAEKITGYDINEPGDPDIEMAYNINFNWYFGLDGLTPPDKHDFLSVVLHEIGHGLGFYSSTGANDNIATYAVSGLPNSFVRHLETGTDQNIVETITDLSATLRDVIVGGDVHFRSFYFPETVDRPSIYAPETFSGGSSIHHLDEDTYPNGNINSLMSPFLGKGESIHDPGLAYEMFQDIGWVAMDIDFTRILDTEDSISNNTITAIVQGDSTVLAGGVNLHYSYDGFLSDTVTNMVATLNPNEYTADILATSKEETVSYYINVDAAGGKTFTSPGEAPDFFYQFVMAKDTIAPVMDHKPLSVTFLNNPVVSVVAIVTENINVGDLMLTYKINSGTTTTIPVPLISSTADGFYEGEYLLDWDLGALGIVEGDTVKYKLEIQDMAAIPNLTTSPETGFYDIQVLDFNEPVALYENDFNTPTTDFAGFGFVIGPEGGFDSEAIHSDHPYRVENGVDENDTLTHIYLLKTPIILSDKDASMSFDEVVLVEPGTAGTVYGDDEFWDYAVVEGSNDFGLSWVTAADGYDSREHIGWLNRYNSANDGENNSTAVGDKSLFIKKEIDLTANGNFAAGDTVLIRFRMFIDPFAHGWGWAIDNLKIQIDEEPPVLTQITQDYMMIGDTQIVLESKVIDNVELDSVIYEVDFNGEIVIQSFPGSANLFTYNLSFDPAITATDVLKYRIIAVDKALIPNTSITPSIGFFEVPVAVLETAREMYVNDFNTASDDFIGVNFSIKTAQNFSDPALVSTNPYSDAPFATSEMSYLLKYPIILNQGAALVQWDEVALVEPDNDEVAFEVSKDGGATWIAVFDPYDASDNSSWSIVFNNFDSNGNSKGVGQPNIMKRRFFNMLDNDQLSGGDEVLVRFRMTVNDNVHGWGWLIDNLEIQGPTTAIEDKLVRTIQVYPNPTSSGSVVLSGTLSGTSSHIVVTDILGKIVLQDEVAISNNTLQTTLDLTNLKNGIYLISVSDKLGIYTSRVVVE